MSQNIFLGKKPKRRDSILKTRPSNIGIEEGVEQTKSVIKRRVSFHNVKTVQNFAVNDQSLLDGSPVKQKINETMGSDGVFTPGRNSCISSKGDNSENDISSKAPISFHMDQHTTVHTIVDMSMSETSIHKEITEVCNTTRTYISSGKDMDSTLAIFGKSADTLNEFSVHPVEDNVSRSGAYDLNSTKLDIVDMSMDATYSQRDHNATLRDHNNTMAENTMMIFSKNPTEKENNYDDMDISAKEDTINFLKSANQFKAPMDPSNMSLMDNTMNMFKLMNESRLVDDTLAILKPKKADETIDILQPSGVDDTLAILQPKSADDTIAMLQPNAADDTMAMLQPNAADDTMAILQPKSVNDTMAEDTLAILQPQTASSSSANNENECDMDITVAAPTSSSSDNSGLVSFPVNYSPASVTANTFTEKMKVCEDNTQVNATMNIFGANVDSAPSSRVEVLTKNTGNNTFNKLADMSLNNTMNILGLTSNNDIIFSKNNTLPALPQDHTMAIFTNSNEASFDMDITNVNQDVAQEVSTFAQSKVDDGKKFTNMILPNNTLDILAPSDDSQEQDMSMTFAKEKTPERLSQPQGKPPLPSSAHRSMSLHNESKASALGSIRQMESPRAVLRKRVKHDEVETARRQSLNASSMFVHRENNNETIRMEDNRRSDIYQNHDVSLNLTNLSELKMAPYKSSETANMTLGTTMRISRRSNISMLGDNSLINDNYDIPRDVSLTQGPYLSNMSSLEDNSMASISDRLTSYLQNTRFHPHTSKVTYLESIMGEDCYIASLRDTYVAKLNDLLDKKKQINLTDRESRMEELRLKNPEYPKAVEAMNGRKLNALERDALKSGILLAEAEWFQDRQKIASELKELLSNERSLLVPEIEKERQNVMLCNKLRDLELENDELEQKCREFAGLNLSSVPGIREEDERLELEVENLKDELHQLHIQKIQLELSILKGAIKSIEQSSSFVLNKMQEKQNSKTKINKIISSLSKSNEVRMETN